MSLFSELLGKIFGHAQAASPASPTAAATPAVALAATAGSTAPAAASVSAPSAAAPVAPAGSTGAQPVPSPVAAPANLVDVGAILDGLQAKSSESLDWKKSIVDLMKLVGMDSSLSARKQLATELHYSGDMSDSATMNVWLHQEVMQKLAANGGKVPADLLH